jgi:hypothetical protein
MIPDTDYPPALIFPQVDASVIDSPSVRSAAMPAFAFAVSCGSPSREMTRWPRRALGLDGRSGLKRD